MKKMILIASALGLAFVINACGGSSSDSLANNFVNVAQKNQGHVLTFEWTPKYNSILNIDNSSGKLKFTKLETLTDANVTKDGAIDFTDKNVIQALSKNSNMITDTSLNTTTINFNAKDVKQNITCTFDHNDTNNMFYGCIYNNDINTTVAQVIYPIEFIIPKKGVDISYIVVDGDSHTKYASHYEKLFTLSNYNATKGWTIKNDQ